VSVQSKRIRGVLLCLVLACVVALVAGCDSDNSDDENAIVTGTVADQTTLDNVAGITVQVGDARSAVTGTSGEFTLGPAPEGAQTVLAYGTGYSTARIAKTLAPGNNNVGTIYLREGPKSGKGDVAGTVVPYSARLINATVTGGGKTARTVNVNLSTGEIEPYDAETHTGLNHVIRFYLYNLTPGNTTLQVASEDGKLSGKATVSVSAGKSVAQTISASQSPPGIPGI